MLIAWDTKKDEVWRVTIIYSSNRIWFYILVTCSTTQLWLSWCEATWNIVTTSSPLDEMPTPSYIPTYIYFQSSNSSHFLISAKSTFSENTVCAPSKGFSFSSPPIWKFAGCLKNNVQFKEMSILPPAPHKMDWNFLGLVFCKRNISRNVQSLLIGIARCGWSRKKISFLGEVLIFSRTTQRSKEH